MEKKIPLTETGNKVLVGMSGGVDSSVTACLLKEKGYDVIGIHLHFWVDPTLFTAEEKEKFPQNKCCTLEGLQRTRTIARRLGIPFYVLDFEDIFKDNVVDYFVETYAEGLTPNPCIECNRTVKFGYFLDKMRELGADYLATGHYARNIEVEKNGQKHYELWTAKDTYKDQSYFLYTLTQEKLQHILFPIGEYTKPEVRELARKFNINEVNQQKESQNLCFFPEESHTPFLRRYLPDELFIPGPIMTTEGIIIGEHQGLPSYTIGQRKGLGLGGIKGDDGTPWYVVKIDRRNNTLIVGKEKSLQQQTLEAHTLSFVYPELKDSPDSAVFADPLPIHAKIRARFPRQPATLRIIENGQKAVVEFEKSQRAITSGQSVVFYQGDKVLGGGIIA